MIARDCERSCQGDEGGKLDDDGKRNIEEEVGWLELVRRRLEISKNAYQHRVAWIGLILI